MNLLDMPTYNRIRWINRSNIVSSLEFVQDLIIICLCLGLFGFMVLQLRDMFMSLLPPVNLPNVTADILFLLILVELFRLLIIYLREKRVSIGVTVEVSIVSALREIIVNGILEIPWLQVLMTCLFLSTLALLLVVRVWLPPTFEGINPEERLSQRRRSELHNDPPHPHSVPNGYGAERADFL